MTKRLDWAFKAFALICAGIWVFPLYWALTTSFRSEDRVVAGSGW